MAGADVPRPICQRDAIGHEADEGRKAFILVVVTEGGRPFNIAEPVVPGIATWPLNSQGVALCGAWWRAADDWLTLERRSPVPFALAPALRRRPPGTCLPSIAGWPPTVPHDELWPAS